MPQRMTRHDVERMCFTFDQLAAAHMPIAPDASIHLHNTIALGKKGQRVLLIPGLYGQVVSDDGKELVVLYRDAKAWLANH